jgi:hypothetical protein
LWSIHAVEAMRKHACKGVVEALNSFPPEQGSSTTESEETDEAEARKVADHNKHLRVQRLFDSLYLSSAFCSTSRDDLADVLSMLKEAAGVDAAAEQRITKSAHEYWKRTSLLFGLLAIR